MKRFYLGTASAGMVLTLMSVPPAMAQQQQSHNNGGPMQSDNNGGPMQSHNNGGPMQMGYNEQNQRHWHNGEHYDGSRQVVDNWGYYHLRQPPEGYEWVRDGSQFVLIAVASGIITDIILNSLNH